ncbi:MAG TPA: DUF3185 family protein [Hypericibacter adhaerens]|jgi:hypothetical protein|uniref:DUF3185 family protein n=1 Tax=Hypericibacter adhaerens TaxID=2602016 RepID=A0A5J6N0W0_9PROT|nr:DUF3185 family protein [Hypericibacter adhaerens]QEX23469.1 hypothetical protein FRZ61_34070 [Hypericibacter adhaerens]HWA41583.1 DUF3185 family protein [Hypericibacter adhaerens]
MSLLRALGLILAAGGGVFLPLGLKASEAPVEQLSEALTGRYADHTLWYIAGGLGAMIAGVCLALSPKQ